MGMATPNQWWQRGGDKGRQWLPSRRRRTRGGGTGKSRLISFQKRSWPSPTVGLRATFPDDRAGLQETAQAHGHKVRMALHPDSWKDRLPALERLVYFRRTITSYYKAETDISGRSLGIRDLLVPSEKTGKTVTFEWPQGERVCLDACVSVCLWKRDRYRHEWTQA